MIKNAIAAFVGSACALLLCTPSSLGEDPTWTNLSVTGTGTINTLVSGTANINLLLVTGTVDIQNNTLLFGMSEANPGISAVYHDGTGGAGSAFTLTATRPSMSWNWQRLTASGTSVATTMQLDASNRLILTGTAAVNPPQLILDPNGVVSLNGNNLLTRTDADALYLSATAGLVGSNGNIGIGTSTPSAKLDIIGATKINGSLVGSGTAALDVSGKVQTTGSATTPVGSVNLFKSYLVENVTAGNKVTANILNYSDNYNYYSQWNEMNVNPTRSAWGGNAIAQRNLCIKRGDYNYQNNGSGGIIASSNEVSLFGNGSISGCGSSYRSGIDANGGNFVRYSHIYIKTPYNSGTGSYNNLYGVYIEPQKQSYVANAYGIYSSGTSDINYFAGNVGIGTSSPQAKLDIVGATKINGNTKITGALVVTGTLDVTTNTVVATGTGQLMLIPQQGDLLMGSFTNGAEPR